MRLIKAIYDLFWNKDDLFQNEAEMFRNIICTGISRNSISIIYKNYSTALIKQGYSISLGLDYLGGAL